MAARSTFRRFGLTRGARFDLNVRCEAARIQHIAHGASDRNRIKAGFFELLVAANEKN